MFQILEHTADMGFRASAKDLPELFETAACALMDIAMDTTNVIPRESMELTAEGESLESLLVNWLSEVLYRLDGEGLALSHFKVRELTPNRVVAEASGEHRDSARHEAKLVIKGVTYHQLRIEHNKQGWSCEVYLDV